MTQSLVAFDFETSGALPEYALQPWRVETEEAWVTSLAVATETAGEPLVSGGLDPTRDDMQRFLEAAIASNSYIVGWNTAFDISWLLAYGLHDLVFKAKWLDGMLLWRHYSTEPEYDVPGTKRKSYSLKTAVAAFMPEHAGYEAEVNFHDVSPAARAKLHEYNIKDTVFTLKLTRDFLTKLGNRPKRLRAALVEASCLPLIAQANLEGMLVDVKAARQLQTKLAQTAADALKSLSEHGATEAILRSPKKLATLLFDVWKLTSDKSTKGAKTGETSRSTDKTVLHDQALVDPRVKLVRAYRDAVGNQKKFADTPLASVEYNGDGRTRPAARIFGTYSGRLTYASAQGRNKDKRQIGFALHQQKRDAEFRNIIRAPEGYTLVEFDASGQEFRWMAIAAGDTTMRMLCQPGEDPHAYMGASIEEITYDDLRARLRDGDPEAKQTRQLGKVANLSLQYRTSAKKLQSVARVQYGLDITLEKAEQIHKTYRQTYHRVPTYWATQIAFAEKNKYVVTFADRRVELNESWSGPLLWSMQSTAINYRIQGTGADQKYLALAVLKPYLAQIGGRFAWDLHDGIYFYIPDAKVDEAVVTMMSQLNSLPYEKMWKLTPPIPLPWDCKIGKSWGQLKEVHL